MHSAEFEIAIPDSEMLDGSIDKMQREVAPLSVFLRRGNMTENTRIHFMTKRIDRGRTMAMNETQFNQWSAVYRSHELRVVLFYGNHVPVDSSSTL